MVRIASIVFVLVAGLLVADFVVTPEAAAQSLQTRLLFQSNKPFRSGSFTQRPTVQRQQFRVERQRLSAQRIIHAQTRARDAFASAKARAQLALAISHPTTSVRRAIAATGTETGHSQPPAAIVARALPPATVQRLKASVTGLPIKPSVTPSTKSAVGAKPNKPTLVPKGHATTKALLSSEQAAAAASAGKKLQGLPPMWQAADLKDQEKLERQMEQRGWTNDQISEAYLHGSKFLAENYQTKRAATRYVHPATKRSVVIDNDTQRVIHVGGDGFNYD